MIRDSVPGDRRQFFRESVGSLFERALEATEERVIQQRYLRPPGATAEDLARTQEVPPLVLP